MGNFQFEWVLRLICGMFAGIAIGYERHNRAKAAGIRTHAIVALAACIFMIVSKYGFEEPGKYDMARVAAQVVSGVGFLGAGVIFVRNDSVRGLTTAAGIFITAAIGMTFGAGMYAIGTTAMILLIVMQVALRSVKDTIRTNVSLEILMEPGGDPRSVHDVIHDHGFHNTSFTISANTRGYVIIAESYSIKSNDPYELVQIIQQYPNVVSVRMI